MSGILNRNRVKAVAPPNTLVSHNETRSWGGRRPVEERANVPAETVRREEKRRKLTQEEVDEREIGQQRDAVLLPRADILAKKPKDKACVFSTSQLLVEWIFSNV